MTVNRIEVKQDTITRSGKPSVVKAPKIVKLPLPVKSFIGRDEYLKIIEDSFKFPKTSFELQDQRRFVLYGTGGMGKTQLALKFLHKHNDKYYT